MAEQALPGMRVPGSGGSGLRFSLCCSSQAVCLALEEAVPFPNMHKGAMCAPSSPGRRNRLRTH